MLQKIMIKLLMAKKEQLLALAIEMLAKAYNENKDELANKIFDHLPASMKATAAPAEVETFMDVLKDSLQNLALAAKPLLEANLVGPVPPAVKKK